LKRRITIGCAAASAAALVATSAQATFHLMQVEQLIGGVGGDTTAQAIQLRTRAPNQCFLGQGRLTVLDADGLNPISIQDFSTCPPLPMPCTATCPTGARILIASPGFAATLDNPITPDLTMDNLIPPSYLAAGSLVFTDAAGTDILWRISWGGAAYTGPNDVACTNDDTTCPNPGSVAPPFPTALPSATDQALLFPGGATAVSTNNAADYVVTAGAATFTNNASQSGTVQLAAPCPWDCEASPNGAVGTADLLALLAQWAGPGSCDIDGSGAVSTNDLLDLLGNWGECP
jgi:hypothetical protein